MDINYETLPSEYKNLVIGSFASKNTKALENFNKTIIRSEFDHKSPLDQAFRDVLLELFEQDANVDVLQSLVLFCIETCRKNMTTPTMPVVLLGDIFDALTLDDCEVMFTFVENEVNIWKENLFFTSCKNNLLRMCNDLLRRLSRSSATVFCGRILLFLAKFFPFSERSGLNIVSEFNLENITAFGADGGEAVMEVEVAGTKKNIIIDYSLYCKFWSLQDFFRNPNQCYVKLQWKTFCSVRSHANNILSTFQGLKLDYVSKEFTLKDCSGNESIPYFSKYLTNQKLLDLQLYDVNFRRFVLLQFLILFQYLTSSVKFKSENFELKVDQKDWIVLATDKIYGLLKETPPDGENFAQIVKNILQREEHWNIWKNDGCPEFAKSIAAAESSTGHSETRPEPQYLGDVIKEANSTDKYYMGSAELTKLWNLYPDNLEACKAKDRDFLPSLDNYFAEAIEQLESVNVVKYEEKLLKDGNFGWRALRLLARRSPHFFTYSNNPINQLPDYLEMMVRKVAADRPGRVQENQEATDAEFEEDLFKAPEEEPSGEEKMQTESEPFTDDNNSHPEVPAITASQLDLFSQKIAPEWKKLAAKLGYKSDEIKFFEDENTSPAEQARNMLVLWFEDDVDATLANLVYILEGLSMLEAAEIIKNELKRCLRLNQNF